MEESFLEAWLFCLLCWNFMQLFYCLISASKSYFFCLTAISENSVPLLTPENPLSFISSASLVSCLCLSSASFTPWSSQSILPKVHIQLLKSPGNLQHTWRWPKLQCSEKIQHVGWRCLVLPHISSICVRYKCNLPQFTSGLGQYFSTRSAKQRFSLKFCL